MQALAQAAHISVATCIAIENLYVRLSNMLVLVRMARCLEIQLQALLPTDEECAALAATFAAVIPYVYNNTCAKSQRAAAHAAIFSAYAALPPDATALVHVQYQPPLSPSLIARADAGAWEPSTISERLQIVADAQWSEYRTPTAAAVSPAQAIIAAHSAKKRSKKRLDGTLRYEMRAALMRGERVRDIAARLEVGRRTVQHALFMDREGEREASAIPEGYLDFLVDYRARIAQRYVLPHPTRKGNP